MRKVSITSGVLLALSLGRVSAAYDFRKPLQNGVSPTQKTQSKPKEESEPNLDGLVEVSFKIDDTGKIQILNINSTSPQLTDFVIKKLGKVKLDQGTNPQKGKVIKYSFVFKKQA